MVDVICIHIQRRRLVKDERMTKEFFLFPQITKAKVTQATNWEIYFCVKTDNYKLDPQDLKRKDLKLTTLGVPGWLSH